METHLLSAGTRFAYRDDVVTVLRDGERTADRVGLPVVKYWCSRASDGEEGFVTVGRDYEPEIVEPQFESGVEALAYNLRAAKDALRLVIDQRAQWKTRAEAAVEDLKNAARSDEHWHEKFRKAESELALLRPLVAALEADEAHGNLAGRAEDAWDQYRSKCCDGSASCRASVHTHGCYMSLVHEESS